MTHFQLRNVLNIRKKYWPVTSSILPQAQPSLQHLGLHPLWVDASEILGSPFGMYKNLKPYKGIYDINRLAGFLPFWSPQIWDRFGRGGHC